MVGRELSSHVTQAGRDGHEVTVIKLVIGKDSLAAEQHHTGTVTADPQIGQLVFCGGGRREGECSLDRPAVAGGGA